ncbi:MAG: efflux RND transporter periplasmic adaptor subunit [Pseudomonadota bacterium]
MTYDDTQAATRTPRPNILKGLVFLGAVAIVAVLLAVFVLGQRSQEGPFVPTAAPDPLSVDVVEVSLSQTFSLEERFTGIVSPRRTSRLGPQTGGRITRLYADVGDQVKAGRLLASLDTRALEAQLAAAEASVTEADAAHKLALATVQRQQTLFEKGHVAQQRVDEAVAQADSAKARIDAAKAQAATVQVQIDLARIIAPYSGVIMARMADEGAIAGSGQPIFELVENGRLEARIGLPARVADTLNVGDEYTLVSDQGDVAAKLRAATGVIEAGQRTVTTVFDVNDPSSVAAGAVIRLNLMRDVEESGLWLPVSALAEGERGLWSVYIAREADDDLRAVRSVVEIVHSEGDRAYVRGGIRNGDLVILDGLQRITPGQPVKAVRVSSTGGAQQAASLELQP